MTRYSEETKGEVREKDADRGQRRTKPRDIPALSPRAIDNLYSKGRVRPREMKAEDHEAPQRLGDPINLRGKLNDVPESSWLRGGGRAGEDYACFDTGRLDPSSKPPKPAKGLRASGADCTRSPFSAAYRKGAGEGF